MKKGSSRIRLRNSHYGQQVINAIPDVLFSNGKFVKNSAPEEIIKPKKLDYRLTHHARDRYVQRTMPRFKHLLLHNRDRSCELCLDLTQESMRYVKENWQDVTAKIFLELSQSKECRSFVNNSNMLARLCSKYGYDCDFKFMVHDEAVFVIRCENYEKVVITTLNKKHHDYT